MGIDTSIVMPIATVHSAGDCKNGDLSYRLRRGVEMSWNPKVA